MKQLGPYELLGVVGRGGMGTVYRARHVDSGDIVAVKALAQNHNEDDHFRQRFESEINALLKLDHPNIVRLLGYGEEDGAMYFAMELVEGKSLFSLQREIKTFDWRDVLVICKDVASGLRHAHDRGIIHRDLKPGNLLKSKDGIIKVTDFGIAKAYGVSHDTRDNVVGTIDYMSPEQALGRPVTARSDLYSLGVVLFSLLSGQPPFASNSIEQSLRNLTRVRAPKIRSRVPSVPDALEDVIDELLEKKPENRTPTAYALLRKLDYVEQVLRGTSEAATSHGKPTSGTSAPKQTNVRPENTFRLGKPGDGATDEPVELPAKSGTPTSRGNETSPGSAQKSGATRLGQETVVESEIQFLESPEPRESRQDFFNPVTDDERRRVFQATEEQVKKQGTGWIPVLLSLVVVLAMVVYGTIQALRVEPADKIFERIADNADQPHTLLEDIEMFLLNYPEDDRATRVRELGAIARAMQKFNRLSARSRMPRGGELSILEREFVDVVSQAESNPSANLSKLESFIVLHDAGEDTPDSTMEIVSAAKYYLQKIRQDSSNQQYQDRKDAKAALDRARTDPTLAEDTYESLIELYKDREWVRDYVRQAEEELDLLKKEADKVPKDNCP